MNTFKIAILLIVSHFSLDASEYYSKIEPYKIRNISSNVSGVVLEVKENMLGNKLSKEAFIVIDSTLDKAELKAIDSKLKYTNEILISNGKILQNLSDSLDKKRKNYEKVKEMKIKSSVEKDREFYDLVASENSALATQKEMNTLKNQMTDLEFRKAQLTRNINDKELKAEGFTLYSLDVKVGQVVNKSTPLATVVDTNKALLTIYLNESDFYQLKNLSIYLNNKKTDYKINRVLNIADSKNISKYKAQIIIKAPKLFSKLMKVELRYE